MSETTNNGMIEVPEEFKKGLSDPDVEVKFSNPDDMITEVPGILRRAEVVPEDPSNGEYTGGDIEAIAARSGVDPKIVAQAAIASMARQRAADAKNENQE